MLRAEVGNFFARWTFRITANEMSNSCVRKYFELDVCQTGRGVGDNRRWGEKGARLYVTLGGFGISSLRPNRRDLGPNMGVFDPPIHKPIFTYNDVTIASNETCYWREMMLPLKSSICKRCRIDKNGKKRKDL